jgi:hypothetical protein
MKYLDEEFDLIDEFTDIGYMADNIEVFDANEKSFQIKRSHPDKSMTLLISFPFVNELFEQEILMIDSFLNEIQVPINCYFIFDKQSSENVALGTKLKKFELYFDQENEFGGMYGTKIVNTSLQDKLTKSLFLISKDGAIFYLDMPDDLSKALDMSRLQVELNKAYVSYTGVGCHG